MISQYTWPNYQGPDRAGCQVILDEQGYGGDVQFGKTKIFIKTPQTVFGLEEARSKLIPGIVVFLQKVSTRGRHLRHQKETVVSSGGIFVFCCLSAFCGKKKPGGGLLRLNNILKRIADIEFVW